SVARLPAAFAQESKLGRSTGCRIPCNHSNMEDDSDLDGTDARARLRALAVVMNVALSVQLAVATLWMAFVAAGEHLARAFTQGAPMREYVLASVVVWLSSTLAYVMARGGRAMTLAAIASAGWVLVGQQRAFETSAIEPVFALGPGLVVVLALASMIVA